MHLGERRVSPASLQGWQGLAGGSGTLRGAIRVCATAPPLVREWDGRVVVGRRAVADVAMYGEQGEEIEVRLMDATDDECDLYETADNADRRHSSSEQRRAIVEIINTYELALRAERGPKGPGRPRSKRSRARQMVADDLGIAEQQVRRHDEKAQQEAQEAAASPLREDFGVGLAEEWLDDLRGVAAQLSMVETKLRSAQAQVTKLERLEIAPVKRLRDAKRLLRDAARVLRDLKPESLCPYCKGQEGLQEDCEHCERRGWVGKLERTPEPLLSREELSVVVGGKIVPLESLEEALGW